MTDRDQNEASTSCFQSSSDVVSNRIDDGTSVLVNMQTNRVYELNRTGTRFWELLCEGYDRKKIQQLMLQEFDVAEADLAAEIEALLTSLESEGLITPCEETKANR